LWELSLRVRLRCLGCYRWLLLLTIVELAGCGVASELLDYRHELLLGVDAVDDGVVKLDHIILEVLGLVDKGHFPKILITSVSFTVSIIKLLISQIVVIPVGSLIEDS
jgi:hypothetical protein